MTLSWQAVVVAVVVLAAATAAAVTGVLTGEQLLGLLTPALLVVLDLYGRASAATQAQALEVIRVDVNSNMGKALDKIASLETALRHSAVAAEADRKPSS